MSEDPRINIPLFKGLELVNGLIGEIKETSGALHDHLMESAESKPTTVSAITAGLTHAIEHGNVSIRRSAVEAIGIVARKAPGYVGHSAEKFVDLLLNVLPTDDNELKAAAVHVLQGVLQAIRRAGGKLPCKIAQTIIATDLLTDDNPSIRQVAMQTLQCCGAVDAVATVPAVMAKLDDPVAEVQCEACRTLAMFGVDALSAVSKLVKTVKNEDEDEEVRRAAAQSLARIDPDGKYVVPAIRDIAWFGAIIRHLSGNGDEETKLRRALQEKKFLIEQGPLPGYDWMRMHKIVGRVFGPNPEDDPEKAKTWYDSKQRNLVNWIDEGILPAMRVKRGTYAVSVEHLKGLQETHFPSSEDSQQASDKSDKRIAGEPEE